MYNVSLYISNKFCIEKIGRIRLATDMDRMIVIRKNIILDSFISFLLYSTSLFVLLIFLITLLVDISSRQILYLKIIKTKIKAPIKNTNIEVCTKLNNINRISDIYDDTPRIKTPSEISPLKYLILS
ncbi:hypothetical protein [Nanobdella aerobiophila]|uniref:hypothetical protein n=1 Tax=Nanobdella aerobiophila TaxID=2586965 RepID=UPI0021ABD3BD|nr:hypothetical protein [Nanobdella aerobiophila]